MKQFFGEDGFHFFIGTVEDVLDPEKLGRVRVRMYGLHTQDLDMIPTADLPWAVTISPISSASIDGIGTAPVGLLTGSIVIGFWLDGADMQHPAIMGSLPGVPIVAPNAEVGFNDPEELWPCDLDTPDVNIAARGVEDKFSGIHKATEWRMANILGGSTCGGGWEEPVTPAEPIYPNNSVREFKYKLCEGEDYGHVEEFDSTPGAERYCRHHKTSNNFIETHPDGTEVRKVHGDGYELDLANKILYVKGDWDVQVDGNKSETISGNYCLRVGGYFTQTVDLWKNVFVKAFHTEQQLGYKSTITGAYELHTIGAYENHFTAGIRTTTIGALDDLNVAGAKITLVGALDSYSVIGSRLITIIGDRTETVEGAIDTTAASIKLEAETTDIELIAKKSITATAEDISLIAGVIALDGAVTTIPENIKTADSIKVVEVSPL